jgi:two-component system sensor histidine kinase/response regulator
MPETPYTILIVDDNPTEVGFLVTFLEKMNFKARIATDAHMALASVKQDPPDLILLDIIMPDLNGFEVCQRLKADDATKEIPVIFMTALADPLDEVRGFSAGAVDYVTKPITVETLLARIRTHLRLRDLHQEIQQQNIQRQLEIHERQQTDKALAEERNLLRTLIDNLPDFIYVKDSESRFLLANKAILASFGLTMQEELVGKTDFDFHPPEMAQQFFEDERRILESGQPLINREETVFDQSRNAITWLLSTKIPLRDSQGKITGLVGINRDITKRKQAEAELLVAHNELQVKNEQLRELNASKDKFFSIISHDLRSPFTALLGYIDLLGKQVEHVSRTALKEYITKLSISAERLYALLENLLTWSRLQRGVMEYAPEQFDLKEIVDDMVELFTSNAEQKQIRLTSSVQETLVVYADYAMVNTIMRNLVSNALKFTPTSGNITIAARYDTHDVEIAVSDTGNGMSPETMAKLFRIDGHPTTTGTAGETGTGLGLILCQDLVQKNGGKIWVESKVGKGTTFRFTLPILPV